MKRISLLMAVLAAACAAVAGDSSGAASSYPSPLQLRSTASSVAGSWALGNGTGSANTATSNVSVDNSSDDGWYVFAPGTQSSTRLGSSPTGPDGTGWVVDPAGGAAGFPAGTWTFKVRTKVPGGTLVPGTAVLTVGMWKGTISGGTFTPAGPPLLPPTDDPGSHNLRLALDTTTNVSYSLPAFSLGAGETLFVELWRHQVGGIADPAATNRTLQLVANDGSSKITHPPADSSAPTHAFSIKAVTGQASFKASASTIYYRGSNAGSFRIDDKVADSGAGTLQVTYPLVLTAGWTHAAETIATPPDFTSSTYSWTAGSTTSPGAQLVVAEDKALQLSTATLTLTNDTTGPTGQSVDLSGGPTFSTLSVPLTLVKGTDAGAGVAGGSGVVERASATATGGSCGTFGSWAPVTLDGGADTTVAAGTCYRYRYTISDVLGNDSGPSAPSADAIVDAAASSSSSSSSSASATTTTSSAASTAALAVTPTEVSGAGDQYYTTGTVWFRPAGSGSFTLGATGADVSSVKFPDVSAASGWSGSTGGTDSTSPFASPAAYTWTAGATAPGAQTVTGTTATGTVTATVTISADSTAPSGQTIAPSGGPFFASASVPLTVSRGTDSGAGVDASGDVVERASAPLRNGTCGTFGAFAAVTLAGGADTTVATGNCYRWQLKVRDNVGNLSAASTPSADAKVDSTPPAAPNLLFTGLLNAGAAGNVVYYRPGATGSFTVTASGTDAESGVASYTFPTIPGFTQVGARASRTYNFTSSATAPTAPLPVTAANGAGLASAPSSFTLVPDARPPTLTVRCNGKPCVSSAYAGPVVVAFTGADSSGAGLDTIRYSLDGAAPTKDVGLEYTQPLVVRSLAHLKVLAFDKAGNASRPLSLTVRSLADRLVFGAPVRINVAPADHYMKARVSSTARAHVVAVMTGRGLASPQRWRFTLQRGAWIVQLRLPETCRRRTPYTVRWTVSAGTRSAAKVTQVTLR